MARIRRLNLSAIPNCRDAGRYLYVIGEEGYDKPVKVGFAAHPVWRMYDLQSGNPRKLSLLATWYSPDPNAIRRAEANVKDALSGHQLVGEWFDVTAAEAIMTVNNIVEALQ